MLVAVSVTDSLGHSKSLKSLHAPPRGLLCARWAPATDSSTINHPRELSNPGSSPDSTTFPLWYVQCQIPNKNTFVSSLTVLRLLARLVLQIWCPVMYLARFPLQAMQVAKRTQHTVFAGLTLTALSHGIYVLSEESSM